MTKFRGFIAAEIKEFDKLHEIENEIRKTGANIKLVEPENIHITLKFLGDTEEELVDNIKKIIEDSTKNIEPFQIKLQGMGVFPNDNYIKVIWIGIKQGEPLATIASEIDKKLNKIGFKKEKRGFSPHLTIGRVKSVKNKEKILEIIKKYKENEFKETKIDSIKLKKSVLTPKGPIYSDLIEVKLQ